MIKWGNTSNRRDFLRRIAGAGAAGGYAVLVHAGPGAAQEAPPLVSPSERMATPSAAGRLDQEPHMALVDLDCDFLVAGGGMAGVCAAIAAARHGAKVVLVQDRSRLGGNASSEVRMHIVGADDHNNHPGWREGGILEELRLENAARNPEYVWELWDLILYDKVASEPNITLLLDTAVCGARVEEGRIREVRARCDKTEHLYRIHAKSCADCTGDCRLGLEAGAAMRTGHEGRAELGESLAPETGGPETLGSSILFTSRDYGRPVPFTPPPWARKVTKDQLEFRGTGSWEYGYWWIEWGGQHNAIRDNERIRFELLSIVLGVWDYIKNSGEHPDSANWGMTWLGMVPGKRSSRRLVGPHYLTQQDLLGLNGDFDDAVAIGGWPFDNHPPAGFDDPTARPADQVRLDEVYNIPLRALYSVNIDNLFMAGRNVSASHVAFTSMRVMATCAVEGQAIGTAAALCAREGLLPREVIADPAKTAELQQALLRDDQTIKGRVNADPLDFARHARVTASSEAHGSRAVHVINGRVRDLPEAWENRWGGVMTPEGAWIELAWDMPQRITHVQLYFDSGFHRELTLSESHAVQKRQIRGPQPETVKDYELLYRADVAGPWETLVTVRDNYQRLRRHTFRPVEAHALRLHVTATNGAEEARVYEIRCYG